MLERKLRRRQSQKAKLLLRLHKTQLKAVQKVIGRTFKGSVKINESARTLWFERLFCGLFE